MNKTAAWMPLWIGDYLADTMHLNATQHGAYLLLLMAHWRRPEGLPNDDEFLRQTAKMTEEQWLSEAKACLAFFDEKDGLLVHKRVVEEREKAEAKHAKLSLAGRKGGKAGLSEAKARLKQSQSQSHIDSPKGAVWKEPTKSEVVEAARQVGLTEEQAVIWFDDQMARPVAPDGRWTDRNGQPINNWRYALSAWAGRWKENERQKALRLSQKLNGNPKQPEGVWHLEKRIEATKAQIGRLQGDPRNKAPVNPETPWDRRLKPEVADKITALKASIEAMRQQMVKGQEVAA